MSDRIDPFSFDGKVVLITGATRGIGAAAAWAFARRGARIALSSRKADACAAMEQALRAEGHEAVAVPGHAARDEDVAALVAAALAAFGRIDVAVANAGVNPVFGPVTALGEDVWAKTIDTNLSGPWRLARHALPEIARGGGGAMVFVSSVNGAFGVPNSAAYGTSKAALNHLARQLAVEWGSKGIRINAVAPGTTRTDMVRALTAEPEWVEALLARTPMARIGEPEDVAAAIVFMASEGARHITGQLLTVDGGDTIQRS